MNKTMPSGREVVSHDEGIYDRITGRQLFINDIRFPGMLYGAFFRSAVPRARILEIDYSEALKVPGVVRVFTSRDFVKTGVPRFGPLVADQPVLANGVVKYVGEPIALLIAETDRDAKNAISRIKVIYEELSPLITLDEALSGSLIHNPEQRPSEQSTWSQSNLMGEWNFGWGELNPAERQSDFIIETTYKAPFVHHFAIEPHGAIAIPEDGRITVYSAIQHPFVARRVVSEMLGIDIDKVRVRSVCLGGSFGSKGYPKLEPVIALFAMMLKRPLKIVVTGEEAFFLAQREASQIHIRTGFSQTGDITFQDILADFLVGAYTDISPRVIAKAGFHAAGPYRTPAARIHARGVFTNTPPTTAFRGFGSPHIVMALEGQLNQAARILGRDPLSIRQQNIRVKGEVMVPGETKVDGEWDEILTKVARAIDWDFPRPSGHGRGIAFGMKSCVPGTTSSARIRMRNDGDILIEIGTAEMGQGAIQAFSILVGNSLGISTDQIRVSAGDTEVAPFDAITASSRSAVHMGNAILKACEDISRQIFDYTEEIYSFIGSNLTLKAGRIIGEAGSISIQELLADRSAKGLGEIIGEGCFKSDQDKTHPLGGTTPFYEAVATAVELHIDRGTGNIYIDRMVHVTDAGKLINPIRATGQDDGGNIMGLGLALSEQLFYDQTGHLLNGNSLDYRIPTIEDVPVDLISLFVENADGPGPSGAKGIGEGGILAVVPAICGAILDCTGILFTEIPITPEKLWRALQQNNAEGSDGG